MISAAALVVVLAAVAIDWLLLRDPEPTRGPLAAVEESALSIGQPAGVPFAFGLSGVVNRGDDPAILDEVTIAKKPRGLTIVATANRDALDRPGRYALPSLTVDYRTGGDRHRVTIRNGLSVCVTSRGAPTRRDCPLPKGF